VDDDTRLLPWPKTAAALGEFTSFGHAEDLIMSFGFAPPAHKSSWRPFQVLALLEDALDTSGFPDLAPPEFESMLRKARLQFFEKCLRSGSPRKRRNVTSYHPSGPPPPPPPPPPDRAPVEVPPVAASTAGSASRAPLTPRPSTTPLAARPAAHLLASTLACPPLTPTRFGATRPR
jgi:hypothetical protein